MPLATRLARLYSLGLIPMTTDATFPDLRSEVHAFRAANPTVDYVDLICLDLPGHFYGKRYPLDMLLKIAAGSPLKLPQNCILLGTQGGVFPIGRYCFNDGDPDVPRRLVPGTLKPVSWEGRPLGQMLITSDGTEAPIAFEPRQVLAQVVTRLQQRGIHPVVAFELEFYLFDVKLADGLPQFPHDPLTDDADDQSCMHIERLSRFSGVLHEMVRTAREQGVDANVITAEMGPGQFEINFAHSKDPLQAADWSALFSRSTRGVAIKNGYRASFMSKPHLEAPGSGMHVHVSLYDCDGNNLLDRDQRRPLRHAVAGCLELLPHCMPLFAANHNAFRRFGSTGNSASKASWGFENRDACVRIPDSDGHNLRIEHRVAGADANPYLVLAAILAAMEYGLDERREPIASLNEDLNSGVDFPRDMPSALAAMAAHPVLMDKLGRELVYVYCENKRQDHLAFMHSISAREYRWFL